MTINGVGTTAKDTSLANLLLTTQTQGLTGLLTGGSDTAGGTAANGVGGVEGDSAQISGPGQLFGQLQQLLTQNPAAFQQVASQIATQLQTAASQATGSQAQFLTNLASQFQTAATTGSLSSLQPQGEAHHSHHDHGSYNQQGQGVPSSSASGTAPTSGATSGGTNLSQLFASISSEVAQALNG